MGNRSCINIGGSATEGVNVGNGVNIYKGKSNGNTLNFKTLSPTGTTMSITYDDDNIYFSASTGVLISGTPNYLTKFNSTGDNIENSAIIDNGSNLCLKCDSIYFGCNGQNITLKATDAPTLNSCLFICPGTCTNWTSGGHRDGYVYIDPGYGTPYHAVYIGSPNYSGFTSYIQSEGNNANVSFGICSKGTSGNIYLNAGSSGYVLVGPTSAQLKIDTLGHLCMGNYCDLTLEGASTSSSNFSGKSVTICGGSASNGNANGGDVTICGGLGVGTGSDGRVVLPTLPSKGAETCVVYIDTNGNLSTGTPTSDCRLKCNIKPIQGAASYLSNICGYSAEFNELSNCNGCCEYVFLAQEVEKELPLAVKNGVIINDIDYKKIEYDQMIPVLWNIVKEQENRIKILEEQIKISNIYNKNK